VEAHVNAVNVKLVMASGRNQIVAGAAAVRDFQESRISKEAKNV